MNIYVGNLSWTMTDEDLSNLFTQFGTVGSAKILKDKMNGSSKGFGFVEMEDAEAAKAAIAGLNETEVQGRKLIVNESQPRQDLGRRQQRDLHRPDRPLHDHRVGRRVSPRAAVGQGRPDRFARQRRHAQRHR